jgi:hypothetical protein
MARRSILILLLALAAPVRGAECGGDLPSSNTILTATIATGGCNEAASCQIRDEVTFQVTSDLDLTCPGTFEWTFDDGTHETTSVPSIVHVYTVPKTYTASVLISRAGQTRSVSTPVILLACESGGPPQLTPQTADLWWTDSSGIYTADGGVCPPGRDIDFRVLTYPSVDACNSPFFSWSVSDGTTSSGSASFHHIFAKPGTYDVTAAVNNQPFPLVLKKTVVVTEAVPLFAPGILLMLVVAFGLAGWIGLADR